MKLRDAEGVGDAVGAGVGGALAGKARRGPNAAFGIGMLVAKMVGVDDDGNSRRGKDMEAILWKPTSCIWGRTVSVLGAGMKICITDVAVESTKKEECAAAATGKDTGLMAVRTGLMENNGVGESRLAGVIRGGAEPKSV